MTSFLKKLALLFKREAIKPLPRVNPKKEIVDPVYHFFVHEKSTERKRVYDKALKAAESDQKEVIQKYERLRKNLVSV